MFLEIMLAIIGIATVVAVLSSSEIFGWINNNKSNSSRYADIVRKKLDNGNYKVVAGIFNQSKYKTAGSTWEASQLSDELKKKFGSRSVITINY